MKHAPIILALTACLASLFPAAGPAFAASGGGSGSSGANTPTCDDGYVWNPNTQQCELKSGSTVDDKSLYRQGRDLALAGRYKEALTALGAVRQPDSMTYTMIGYSWRKMGNFKSAQSYYYRALALDPNNVNTHEYLGEAFAERGRMDLAKIELAKVAAIAGTKSEQYHDLSRAIAAQPDES